MTSLNPVFRPMEEKDWMSVAAIYKQGIDTQNATFTQEVPTWEQWDADHLKACRIVAEIDREIAGWASLLPISNREVFRGVAEVSLYLSEKYRGMNLGLRLLAEIIEKSEKNGFWMLQSGIFPENTTSVHIHEKLGFRLVGYREKIGEMNGIWRDIVLLERRSKIVGL